ncbi:MAG TPA: Ig-like domain-containing protein [Candidatus Dormibacteraeota bacterium]|nr:Ig-like domain-containing protein [Candidatus Dormibacteraeota bacterium]
MNSYHDPELEEILQEDDLRHVALMLSSARTSDPPLDEAFRTGLRRQLMKEAWAMSEGRDSWWRRVFAPPGLAWAGAAAGLLLIASVVLMFGLQPPGANTIAIHSSIDGDRNVELHQPILVSFNQPMDHPSTERAVQITPATVVTFSWEANTLAVQPASRNLAPNTQYKVTIGPGAKTAAGKQLSSPQTITFVTQPPATPTPTPTPRATPSNALGEKQLTTLAGATALNGQWSADSSTFYAIDRNGALKVVPASGGSVTVIAADGVSALAISPAGDRLAYVRGGKIEVLTFASGQTTEVSPTTTPALVGWAQGTLLWADAEGIDSVAGDGSIQQVVALPKTGPSAVVSIAPDGAHAVYRQEATLFLLDLATGKSVQLGQANATFAGWSPNGRQALYAMEDQVVVADTQGATQATLPHADVSWSTQDAILLGSDTNLYQVRPDGSNLTRLGNGTYHTPTWAPNGTSFAFARGGALWVATAPALPPLPTTLEQAATVVNSFMKARLGGDAANAGTFLSDSGKKAYGSGGLNLLVSGDPTFTRYYVLAQEVISTDPDSALFVVRLVLTHEKIDVSDYEETLNLVRDSTGKQFVIDQASARPHRDLGKGAEVVNVDVEPDTVKVTFDSDLDPGTVTDGVYLVDSRGKQVDATVSYASRTVTLSGLGLKHGAQYRLVVKTSVRDVLGKNVAADYQLDLVGPTDKKHGNKKDVAPVLPSPTATAPAA